MTNAINEAQRIWFHGYNLTTALNAVVLDYGVETQDNTTFTDSTRSMLGGLKTVTAQVEGFYEATPYDAALFGDIGIADRPFSVASSGTAGAAAYSFKCLEGDYSPLKNSVGDIIGFSAGAKATDKLVRGTLMINAAGLTTSGNSGTARQLGAVGAGQKLYAILHATRMDGTSPTLDVTVKSDNAVGFSSPLTKVTFTQMNAIGSQWAEVSGAITDDYWRVDYAVGGSSLNIDFAVILAIL